MWGLVGALTATAGCVPTAHVATTTTAINHLSIATASHEPPLSCALVKPALLITHLPDRQDGIVREALEAAGCAVIERNPDDAEALPSALQVAGVVTLGGRQSATRVAQDPFLTAEVALLRQALEQRVPVLGMCLGAQLLAVAADGTVSSAGHMNAGWPELSVLPAAAEDPLFGAFPARMPVLKWHEDIIEMPPLATELGTTPGPGAALFRVGPCAWRSAVSRWRPTFTPPSASASMMSITYAGPLPLRPVTASRSSAPRAATTWSPRWPRPGRCSPPSGG